MSRLCGHEAQVGVRGHSFPGSRLTTLEEKRAWPDSRLPILVSMPSGGGADVAATSRASSVQDREADHEELFQSIGCWQAGLLMAGGHLRTHRMALTGDMGVPKPPVRPGCQEASAAPRLGVGSPGGGGCALLRTRTDQDVQRNRLGAGLMTLSLSLNLGRTDMFASQNQCMSLCVLRFPL